MAFAVRAISQGTSCSQPCVPRATKAFLFELSENSPSCPFTQEHSEPPVAIIVKVFCSHRGSASSKEPQSPHSGIVSLLHTRLTGHTAQTSTQGLSSSDTWAPLLSTSVHTLVLLLKWALSPAWDPGFQLMPVTHSFLILYILSTLIWIMFAIVYSGPKGGGSTVSHSSYPGIPRGCSIIIDSTNSSSLSLLPNKVCLHQSSIWQWALWIKKKSIS